MDCRRLSRAVVDDGQRLETAAVDELVVNKVHRPNLILALWDGNRLAKVPKPLLFAF